MSWYTNVAMKNVFEHLSEEPAKEEKKNAAASSLPLWQSSATDPTMAVFPDPAGPDSQRIDWRPRLIQLWISSCTAFLVSG